MEQVGQSPDPQKVETPTPVDTPFLNIKDYPGMYGTEPPAVSPDAFRNAAPAEFVVTEPKKSRKGLIIGGVVTLFGVGGLIALGSCDRNVTPKPDVTPTPTASATTIPTETPTTEVSPVSTSTPTEIPSPTSTTIATELPTEVPTPFNLSVFYPQESLQKGDTRWNKVLAKEKEYIPGIEKRPNLMNDGATAGTELSLAKDGILPSDAWKEPIGAKVSIPSEDIMKIEIACLEGEKIPFNPDLTYKICPDVLITSGANLDKNNNKEDKAYLAAKRINEILPEILETIQR